MTVHILTIPDSNCTDKADFMKLFNEAFQTIVHPTVEKAIKAKSLNEKESYVFQNDNSFEKQIAEIDRQARIVAYEYLKLISKL